MVALTCVLRVGRCRLVTSGVLVKHTKLNSLYAGSVVGKGWGVGEGMGVGRGRTGVGRRRMGVGRGWGVGRERKGVGKRRRILSKHFRLFFRIILNTQPIEAHYISAALDVPHSASPHHYIHHQSQPHQAPSTPPLSTSNRTHSPPQLTTITNFQQLHHQNSQPQAPSELWKGVMKAWQM